MRGGDPIPSRLSLLLVRYPRASCGATLSFQGGAIRGKSTVVCNLFAICTYKSHDFISFRIRTYEQSGVGATR
jgi:hypothetical protein